jgi:hypothetical protein
MDAATAVFKNISSSPFNGAETFSGVVAEIITNTFFGEGGEIFARVRSHGARQDGPDTGGEIFSRSNDHGAQGRQISQSDHSGRWRASE